MPIPWAGIGTALGGMGQFAGGLSSLFSGDEGFSGSDIKDALKARLVAARVYGEKFGFHPLAALGVQPYTAGGQKAFKDTGRAMANMGQGLQRALTGKTDLDKAKAKYYDALASKIDSEKNIPGIVEEDTWDAGQQQGKVEIVKPQVKASEQMGVQAGTHAMHVKDIDSKGRVWFRLGEGQSEGYESDPWNQLRLIKESFSDYASQAFYYYQPYGKSAHKHRMEIRKLLNGIRPKAPAGMEYRWNVDFGGPVLRKKQRSEGHLYDHFKSLMPAARFAR